MKGLFENLVGSMFVLGVGETFWNQEWELRKKTVIFDFKITKSGDT